MLRDRRNWRGQEAIGADSTPELPAEDADSVRHANLDLLGLEAVTEVGDIYYEWCLGEDGLIWADNVSDVLGIEQSSALSSGRGYASRLVTNKGTSRY